MSVLHPPISLDALAAEGQDAIRGVIGRRMRVTLHPADNRSRNQDALDACGETVARLLETLRAGEAREPAAVTDSHAIATRLAYRACQDLLDRYHPLWHDVRVRLRFFLSHDGHFAVWEAPDGDLLCGLAQWTGELRPVLDTGEATKLRNDPKSLGIGPLPASSVEDIRAVDWDRVLGRLFVRVDRPVPLDELVRLVMALFVPPRSNEDGSLSPDEIPATGGTNETDAAIVASSALRLRVDDRDIEPLDAADVHRALADVWRDLLAMPLPQRRAFLLNIKPVDGAIDALVTEGIASIADIRDALAFTDAEYLTLYRLLHLAPDSAASVSIDATDDALRFYLVWNHLPLHDALIAQVLGIDPLDVASLRLSARRSLARPGASR